MKDSYSRDQFKPYNPWDDWYNKQNWKKEEVSFLCQSCNCQMELEGENDYETLYTCPICDIGIVIHKEV